jgi:serine-type D-Ala-D-Ala carboxypeptidase (penicillin-binding protein 5/6)
MKSNAVLLAGLLGLATSFASLAEAPAVPAPHMAAKSFVLVDFPTGQTLTAQNPDERIDPASLTKLMTAYLVFEAVKQKKLALTQTLPVSVKAWKAEGSRMFIQPDIPVTVDELLHGVIIQSGNDASIALAEAVAGSEELFAEMMNNKGAQLGMKNTHFINATGLPDKDHYSTAHDIALITGAIIRDFPEFFPLYSQKEYTYNKITQPNRNRLLWLDKFVDGMKTGHTEAAGFCLVSTAKRDDRRLISVVLGTASDNARTVESQKLLNYGFQFFDTKRLYQKGQSVATLEVFKGEAKTVSAGFQRDLFLTLPRDQFAKLKATLATTQPLLAPLAAGQKVGTMKVTLDDKTVDEFPVVALQEVPAAGFFGRTWDSVRLLWSGKK